MLDYLSSVFSLTVMRYALIVGIPIALCAAKEVLLLDEPTTGLDPLVTKELYATVKHLSSEHGMTVIMVSHDVGAALRYSDRILHLATSLRFIGTPEDYLKTPYGAAFGTEENDHA